MSFDWSQYLNLAKELAGQATIPAEQEARLRDAISRSYYAAFILARNYTICEINKVIPYQKLAIFTAMFGKNLILILTQDIN